MNETNLLTAELLKIVQATGNFAIEQAPGFAKEFLQWEFYSHLFMGLLFLAVSILIPYFICKSMKKDRHLDQVDLFFIGLFALFPFVISLIEFCLAAKVKFAPKVYLVENIAKIIK